MINKIAGLLLILLCFESFSQEPLKPIHKKVVYENDGNIYVQKQMPLYLKFSVEPNGQNYNFHSKGTPDFADPMYLDTEGINFIRSKWAVNKDTKKKKNPEEEILYEIYADGVPPTSKIKFSGAPHFKKQGIDYYGKGLKISLSSMDWISGVQQTYFSMNGGYQNYNGSINPDIEKTYDVYYYSVDNVGNVEKTQNQSFVSDLTPPSTSKYFEGRVYEKNILSPNSRVVFTGNDNMSGSKETHAFFDEGTDRITESLDFRDLQDGEHTITYYSIDNVGNIENKNIFDFYLDNIPPKTDIMISGDRHKASSNVNYISPRSNITLKSSDNNSGVEAMYYQVNGGRVTRYGESIILPTISGIDTIIYNAEDRVGNMSKDEYLFVHMDSDPPLTNIVFGAPQFYKSQVLYISSATKISFDAIDDDSDVKETYFAVDESRNNIFEQEFNVNGEGIHSVSYFSLDNVNNEERVKIERFEVDNSPPLINFSFSVQSASEVDDDNGRFDLYPNYSVMFLSATDRDVGTENIYYSVDNGSVMELDRRLSIDLSALNRSDQKRLVTIQIIAEDKLGNRSEKEAKFYIDGL